MKVDPTFTNRTLAIMAVVLLFSFSASIILTSFIFQKSLWPPPVELVVGPATVVTVMMGFMVYHARLRDERAIAVSDKAARNGFMFFIFITAPLVVLSSLRPDLFPDLAITLVVMWISVVVVACLSAVYYYRK
jgi:uncharacterized membrane protein